MNQRVALVTGAAGGQGWAIAKRLRAEGYSVAACDQPRRRTRAPRSTNWATTR